MKILIIGPAWVGDLVMSQTLYRCLQQRYPHATLDVLAVDWCRPILARMPEVRRALQMPIGHGKLQLGLRKAIGDQLKTERYQRAIVLADSWKSALIPWFAKIPQRTGWRGEWRYGLLNDLRKLDPQRYPMQIQRYAALAYPANCSDGRLSPEMLPWPQLITTEATIERTKEQLGLPSEPGPIALAPGSANGIGKCWPPRHYARLAEQLLQEGHWVLLLGAAHDREACDRVQQQLPAILRPRSVNYAGQTSLTQVIDLLACCQALVGNDSGLMHIASALGIAVIALFGPTEPSYTPPLTLRRRILRAPDGHAEPGDPQDQGYHPRLIHLPPQQVFAELQELLAT